MFHFLVRVCSRNDDALLRFGSPESFGCEYWRQHRRVWITCELCKNVNTKKEKKIFRFSHVFVVVVVAFKSVIGERFFFFVRQLGQLLSDFHNLLYSRNKSTKLFDLGTPLESPVLTQATSCHISGNQNRMFRVTELI